MCIYSYLSEIKSVMLFPGLVVVTVCSVELGKRAAPDFLGAAPGLGRLDDHFVILGVMDLALLESSAGFDIKCLWVSKQLAVEADGYSVDGDH